MCLYCEYVVFDFEFSGFVFYFEFFFFRFCLILNFLLFEFWIFWGKKNPEFKKEKRKKNL